MNDLIINRIKSNNIFNFTLQIQRHIHKTTSNYTLKREKMSSINILFKNLKLFLLANTKKKT